MNRRGVSFWVHSTAGLVLAVYAVVIGLSGAVVTFHGELLEGASRGICTASAGADSHVVSADEALAAVRKAYPEGNFLSLTYPNERCENWSAYLLGSPSMLVNVDAGTGEIAGVRANDEDWLGWIEALHANLLTGRPGRLVNGVAAIALAVLTVAGFVVWWPGWSRIFAAFRLHRDASWGRWIWQTHGAVGAVLAIFVLGFSVTGVYFAVTGPVIRAVGAIFPLEEKLDSVALPAEETSRDRVPYAELVRIAQDELHAAPGGMPAPHRISLPSSPRLPVRITFREDHVDAFHNVSSVLLDPYSGAVLQSNPLNARYAGDTIIAWFSAFHLGVFGGWFIKLLWTLLGVALAGLGITGPYLWWRRKMTPARNRAVQKQEAMQERRSPVSRLARATLSVFLLAMLAGCGSQPAEVATGTPEAAEEATVGNLRIVGLSSPLVETVYLLGEGNMIVGVSESCVYPAQVVDDRASGGVAVVGSFTNPSVEEIGALEPDLILTSNQFQRALAEQLREAGYKVLHFEPESLEDVFENIVVIGDAIGKGEQARELTAGYREQLAEIRAISEDLEPVRVYMEMNHNGPWTNGNRSPLEDIIEAAGGENVFADVGAGAFQTTNAEVIARDPEVILSPIWVHAKVGGIDGITTLGEIYRRDGYETVDAIEDSRVMYYDSALMKHEGPRQVLAVRKMAHLLHPEAFADPPGTIDWELGRLIP